MWTFTEKVFILNSGYGGIGRHPGLRSQCQKRGGSSPSIRTINAVIAQLVEQLISNHQVASSILAYSTILPEWRNR